MVLPNASYIHNMEILYNKDSYREIPIGISSKKYVSLFVAVRLSILPCMQEVYSIHRWHWLFHVTGCKLRTRAYFR